MMLHKYDCDCPTCKIRRLEAEIERLKGFIYGRIDLREQYKNYLAQKGGE
jgi:hypothetical protein